jgi:hypothetical protein
MYLNTAGNISLEQFEVIAQGPSRPAATNDTEEGRAANRRVEIYVRDETAKDDTRKALTERVSAPTPPAVGLEAPSVTPPPPAQ